MDRLILQTHKVDCLVRWIRLGQDGIGLDGLLLKRGYGNIALYGLNAISECVFHELRNSEIIIKGIVDRSAGEISTCYPVCSKDELSRLEIDALILMPVDDYQELRAAIEIPDGVACVTLEEILYEL